MPWKPGQQQADQQRKARQKFHDSMRPSSNSRGYDAAWKKFREYFIHRHPLCADCLAEQVKFDQAVKDGTSYHLHPPIVQPTKEVHHVLKVRDRPDLRLREDNCLGLCSTHHARRTVQGQ